MTKSSAESFITVIEEVLKNSPSESIFVCNVNPLRTGLSLYRMIRDLMTEHNFSETHVESILDNLQDQMVNMLTSYKDSDQLLFLIEQVDFEGHDLFWYLDELDLFKILGCQIMDKVIQETWQGHVEIKNSIFDYSTSYNLLYDRYDLYTSDKLF